MKIKRLLFLMLLSAFALPALAQDGGVKGRVVSREGRTALSNVKVAIESLGLTATTDEGGNFQFEGLPAGVYRLSLEAPEFEPYTIAVRVDRMIKDINVVSLVPDAQQAFDDAVFAEFDTEIASDAQALPSSLSSSKDVYNNIASYKFSEMRFNVRGYDSQYSDIYLNGIRFNDAMTGYGPWSLWSGLNDATRNQENTAGLKSSGFGIDGIGGTTNINARASQLRKGFRASVVNGNSMYRFRAMVSYASGQLDNGWSYGFSFSTRQGGNSYVDGVYYNAYGYFASAEKVFGCNNRHRLALSIIGAPTERGAQQASTEEVYRLLGNNYYNPNVGLQEGKLRNTRVRKYHEPIAVLNYSFDINSRTKLLAAASVRFGRNGYSSLSWMYGDDPRPDYYRYLPSYYLNRIFERADWSGYDPSEDQTYYDLAHESFDQWKNDSNKGMIDFDNMYRQNYLLRMEGKPSTFFIEERHTDQLDFNFTTQVAHTFRDQSTLRTGLAVRANRTEYYDRVKDLLGGAYLYDIDKFAERDKAESEFNYQNDLLTYLKTGETPKVEEGDKFNYDYYANVRQAQVWMMYNKAVGGFVMNIGGEVGYAGMWRHGRRMKGLFPYSSLGDSKHLNYLTYKVKGEFSYRFSGAHSIDANVTYMQNAPYFNNAFVSARTRNDVTPNLSTEKVFGAELSYNLNLRWLKARLSGYYTTIGDQSKVISFYDDTYSSFTNFAMSNIDKRHYGLELGFTAPLVADLSLNGALSWGDYRYTSNPDFVQTVDNSTEVINVDRVLWKNFRVESSPQLALNVGLSYRGPHNWFASVDFNYYDFNYLSMNPARRTLNTSDLILKPNEQDMTYHLSNAMKVELLNDLRRQEKFDSAWTLNASVGKTWYIHRVYQLGFSLEVKNLINNQNIRTGGYEQMRISRRTYLNNADGNNTPVSYYVPFDSKYFYLLGTNYYLNVYFRF